MFGHHYDIGVAKEAVVGGPVSIANIVVIGGRQNSSARGPALQRVGKRVGHVDGQMVSEGVVSRSSKATPSFT